MSYTLAQAAEACGLNRTTILRSIKSGKVSGTRDASGSWLVEPVELHRIFPACAPAQDKPKALHQVAQAQAALEVQIAALRQVESLLREQLDDTRKDRDHWRDQAEANQRLVADSRERGRVWWWQRRAAG